MKWRGRGGSSYINGAGICVGWIRGKIEWGVSLIRKKVSLNCLLSDTFYLYLYKKAKFL